MQLFSRKKAFLAVALSALSVLGACGDDVVVSPPTPPVLSITPPSASLNVGESATFVVQFTGGNQTTPPTVTGCTSGTPTVATATVQGNTCRVTAVATGNSTITATASTGGQIAAQVTVSSQNAAISNLTVSPNQANLAVGQSITITPNVQRAATTVTVANAFVSSTPSVATVNATGVVTAVAPGIATITVTSTGSGTGFSTTSLTQAVTINVGALPAGITSLTVQPTSLSLALGQTFSFDTATVRRGIVQPAGCAPAVISFGTSAPSQATVNATTGLVTAVGSGPAVITVTATSPANAQCAASTLTQQISVVVSPGATVTINQVNQGPVLTTYFDDSASTSSSTSQGQPLNGGGAAGILTSANPQVDQPIDITNVRDQIQIIANLSPNGQRVDSAVVFIADTGGTASSGTNRRAAARQIFSNGQANAGPITLFVNTADFAVNVATGQADVFYRNGLKIISVSVYTTSPQGAAVEIQNASNNRQVVNFNNLDGYALVYTNPTRSSLNPDVTLNYYGGPGVEGQAGFTIIPVFYTPGRALVSATVGLRQGLFGSIDVCGAINGTVPFSRETFTAATPGGTLPPPVIRGVVSSAFGRNVAGTATQPSTLNNGVIECGGYEAPQTTASNIPAVVAAIDNQNNPAPRVTFANGYRFSTSVPRPVANRLDYQGPLVPEPDIRRVGSTTAGTWAQPAVTGWVNGSFNFNSTTATSQDFGVGTSNTRSVSYTGCGSAPNALTLASSGTGADIPECATDLRGGYDINGTPAGFYGISTRGPYRVSFSEGDRLGNIGNSAFSQPFGVDKTAPLIRFSQASSPDTTIGNFIFQAEVIDERAGFIDPFFDNGAILKAPTTTANLLLNTTIFGSQHQFASRGAGVITTTTDRTNCINPNDITAINNTAATPVPLSANPFMTAPPCPYRDLPANTITGQTPDGWRSGFLVNIGVDGLYRYQTRVFDRAGNVSDVAVRRAARDNVAPIVTDLNVPINLAAASTPAFQVTAADNVELRANNISLGYGSVIPSSLRLRYPQVLLDARFNDLVNSPNQRDLTVPLPQPFPISLQSTTGTGALAWTSATAGPNVVDVQANLFDVANAPASSPTVLFAATAFTPTQTGFGSTGVNNAGQFTSFSVLPSTNAGFNAGAGLKAQLVSNTNVTNQQFARVDFYRLGGGEYQYLGSSTTPAVADQGAQRFFTYVLPDAQFVGTPTAFETQQAPVTSGDNIIAIGVRANGSGVVTGTGTVIGSQLSTISIPVSGLPSGVSANITLTCTDPQGQVTTQQISGPTSLQVAPNTVCTYTAANSSPAPGTGLVFAPTPTSGNVTAGIAGSTTAGTTISYAGGQTLSVVIAGIGASGTPVVSVSGPSGNFTLLDDGAITTLAPGTYSISAVGMVTIGGTTYALTSQTATSATVTPTTITPGSVTLNYAAVGTFTGAGALAAGGPAAGATVSLRNTNTNVVTTVLAGTSASGVGSTVSLAPGTYQLTAPAVAGYTAPTGTPQTITITSGAASTVSPTIGYAALGGLVVSSQCSVNSPPVVGNCPNGFNNTLLVTGPGGYSQLVTGGQTLAGLAAITVGGVTYYAQGPQTFTVANNGTNVAASTLYSQGGAIVFNISGLPAGVNARVTVTITDQGSTLLTQSATLSNIKPGSTYGFIADDITVGTTVYRASPQNGLNATVTSGAQSVNNLVYSPLP
jgi:uncharacterized protein YjdB